MKAKKKEAILLFSGGRIPDEEIQKAAENYFDKVILPRAKKIIATQSKSF